MKGRSVATVGSLAGVLVVMAAAALGVAAPARSDHGVLACQPTRALLEPTHTRGRSNTIRWEAVEANCWNHGTDRRFVVTITNTATGEKKTVTVRGGNKVEATVEADDFPGGTIDGRRFSYRIVEKTEVCTLDGPFGTCLSESTQTSPFANEVASIQDDRAPMGSLVLAGGKTFVRSLDVTATVTAVDPGGAAASGVGYVAFGGAGPRGGCGPLAGCAEPLGPGLTARLALGADGLRTVEARVYDRARGPAQDPGETAIGTPPGNVSASFNATVFLDRTPPHIFIRISTVRVTVGAPVTFDASQTVDTNGSGVRPATGEWTFGDGVRATSLVATHTYARAGRFPFTFNVADDVGNIARAQPVEVEVVDAPVAPQPGSTETPPQAPRPTTVDRRAPTLSGLSTRRRAGKVLVGFRLSERATVVIEARRLLPKPQRTLGSFRRVVAAGQRQLTVPAVLATRLRAAGSYRFALVARDAAGNRASVRSVRLTVRR